MVLLREVAQVIRSKNAGPFNLTFDVIFDNPVTYEKVKRSKVISTKVIAKLYQVREEEVLFTEYDPAYALKATIPRRLSCGHPADTDVYGAQQHAPLMNLVVDPD